MNYPNDNKNKEKERQYKAKLKKSSQKNKKEKCVVILGGSVLKHMDVYEFTIKLDNC